jgi:hypothetical protein
MPQEEALNIIKLVYRMHSSQHLEEVVNRCKWIKRGPFLAPVGKRKKIYGEKMESNGWDMLSSIVRSIVSLQQEGGGAFYGKS